MIHFDWSIILKGESIIFPTLNGSICDCICVINKTALFIHVVIIYIFVLYDDWCGSGQIGSLQFGRQLVSLCTAQSSSLVQTGMSLVRQPCHITGWGGGGVV